MDQARSTLRATWRSPAKVNLCLRVVGRRPDGYHLLDSVFAAVDLCDRIAIEVRGVAPSTTGAAIAVRCDRPDVPASPANLAARAAALVLRERGLGGEVVLDLRKSIPPGAGLGGGSSNAATVLTGLNGLLGLGVSPERLRELALELGADVPFFLEGGVARVRGVGEIIEPLPAWRDLHLVLVTPPFGVATATAFRAFAARAEPFATGDESARLAAAGRPMPELFVNDLERVVFTLHPELAALKKRLIDAGAAAAVMSGSGSTVLGLASSPVTARGIADVVAADPTLQVHVVGLFDPARPAG